MTTRRIPPLHFLLLSIAALAAVPALADPGSEPATDKDLPRIESPEVVIVNASRLEVPITENPAATTVVEGALALASGSAGLLADTIHNLADLVTSFPLWFAFVFSRRAANRQFTYGFSRSEDLAGIAILLVILGSAAIAGFESIQRFMSLAPPINGEWAMIAALISFAGNELVAQYRIREGRAIGSAALVADGQHARADGVTALAALAGLVGARLGYGWADPLAGIFITVAIVIIAVESGREVILRALDAIDPNIIAEIEKVAGSIDGVLSVQTVRARWLGHAIVAELDLGIDGSLSVAAGHAIGENARHALLHQIDRLEAVAVHVDAFEADGQIVSHELTAHHRPQP
jgi:cation diffusion facilitator family transporter